MVALPFFGLARQTKPIIRKNLLYLLVRNWIPTLLQAAIIPIAILALTLNINNYNGSQITPNPPPSPIISLRDSLSDGKIFIIVTPPGLASDVDDVVKKLTTQLSDIPDQVVLSTNATKDPPQCKTTFHGVSNCHAILIFNDSPKSKINNGTWNYTIKADVARSYDAHSIETIQLPLQLAVDKAITGVAEVPEQYAFDQFTYEQKVARAREGEARVIGKTYAILFFLSYLIPIYHVANTITSERESGFAQLIDSMGGSPASRVLGATITFDLLYLPCWILSGFCKSPYPQRTPVL
jgi:ATP-binding cassette subfamily A (ABC1) protein 3